MPLVGAVKRDFFYQKLRDSVFLLMILDFTKNLVSEKIAMKVAHKTVGSACVSFAQSLAQSLPLWEAGQ